MEPGGHSTSTVESLRDSLKLSRQIMHLANRSIPRVEFLKGLSELLLQFSRCDALELRLHGDVEYWVRAVSRPKPSFTFEGLDPDRQRSGMRPAGTTHPLDLDHLARDALHEIVDPSAPCFTPYGSFWTGNVLDTLSRYPPPSRPPCAEPFRGTVSLALLPFAVDQDNYGLLRLERARPDAFALDMIEAYEAVVETIGLAIAERRAQAALRERVKELACLYSISRVVENRVESTSDAVQQIAGLLPPAWQFPDSAAAKIVLDGTEYATSHVEHIRARQVANILVHGVVRGTVEVGYIHDVPYALNGPFLDEEEHLIEAVARAVGEFAERRQAAAERAKLEGQLRHANRLATLGQLAAGVAHEINEPLGSILGFAQLAGKGDGVTTSTANDLQKIVTACLQAREIVTKLKLFARQAPIQKSWVSVPDTVVDALALVESRCGQAGIEVDTHVEGTLANVLVDPVQLKQLLVNLVVNAVQAMPDGGKLTVTTRSESDATVIEVQDTGLGMTEQVRGEVFNPFFTTKDVGEGTGLGLSVVHGIVTAHGGTIDVASEVGKGSTFTVRLPCPDTRTTPPRHGHDEASR